MSNLTDEQIFFISMASPSGTPRNAPYCLITYAVYTVANTAHYLVGMHISFGGVIHGVLCVYLPDFVFGNIL